MKTDFKEPRRFWSKVDVGEPDECWEWQACKSSNGYGMFWVPVRMRRMRRAHRVAWILTYGPIPTGLYCCHHCDNKLCCNPYHLFLGTQKDNIVDSAKKGRSGSRYLSEEDVHEIREMYSTGEWTHEKLGVEFNVASQTISKILAGRTWAWLAEKEEEISCV